MFFLFQGGVLRFHVKLWGFDFFQGGVSGLTTTRSHYLISCMYHYRPRPTMRKEQKKKSDLMVVLFVGCYFNGIHWVFVKVGTDIKKW